MFKLDTEAFKKTKEIDIDKQVKSLTKSVYIVGGVILAGAFMFSVGYIFDIGTDLDSILKFASIFTLPAYLLFCILMPFEVSSLYKAMEAHQGKIFIMSLLTLVVPLGPVIMPVIAIREANRMKGQL